MVLRRLPAALVVLVLALLLVPAAPAPAQQAQGGGWSGDDPAGTYDDPYDDEDPWGGEDAGGVDPDAPVPAPLPTAPAPALPTAPAPAPAPALPVAPVDALPTIPVTRTIPGTVAKLRTDGKAAIPRGAPQRVQAIIAAANRIVGKPYKWGGGHARLADAGYDCSGAVSYALIGAQLLASPLVSGTLARYQSAGAGRWVSIYANKGHVYLEVAGLRLDTSPVGDVTRRSGVRWRPLIGKRRGFSTRHPTGL